MSRGGKLVRTDPIRRDGKDKGRAPTAMAKSADVRRLAAEGMTREAIAAQLKIGVASVYRALRAA
jgi:DNA invertase Pin-like site-specific DNA recombinase